MNSKSQQLSAAWQTRRVRQLFWGLALLPIHVESNAVSRNRQITIEAYVDLGFRSGFDADDLTHLRRALYDAGFLGRVHLRVELAHQTAYFD